MRGRFIAFRWSEDELLDIGGAASDTFLGAIEEVNKNVDPWGNEGYEDHPDHRFNIVLDTKKKKVYFVRIYWKQSAWNYKFYVKPEYKVLDEIDYPGNVDLDDERTFAEFLDFVGEWMDEKIPIRESRRLRGRMLREATEFVGLQKFTKDDLRRAWDELKEFVALDVKKGTKLEVSCYSDVNGSVDLNYMDFRFDTVLEDLECMDATARSADYEVIYDDKDNDETTGHGILIKHGRIAKVY